MTPTPDTANERPTQSATSDCIAWLKTIDLKLPKLSQASLVREAFAHYDCQLPAGQAKAEEIVVGFLRDVPASEQGSAHRRREKWLSDRCVGYLRASIADANPEITKLAEKTKSQVIRNAVIEKIYAAIGQQYPGLSQETAEAKLRALGKANGRKEAAPLTGNGAEVDAFRAAEQLPEAWKEDAVVRGQVTQVVNAMLIILEQVHEHLVPEAKKFGVVLDAQAEHAWSMSAWITLASGSKVHWKMPTEKAGK